ncbi:MAG: 3-methylornithine--L-lysine ligase PylC [Eubacteriales bacterium]|nr:3-methylornithine--L-lysine ligase PylC [Eubacteriales bacterium]
MRTIVIIGGKLQGVEACYLAKKAGIRAILIDKNPNALASLMADEFINSDIFEPSDDLIELLKRSDLILPALENDKVLDYIENIGHKEGLNIAFDFNAYRISSSKILSDKLFSSYHIPAPVYYPESNPPYILKPNNSSGSEGVRLVKTREELAIILKHLSCPEEMVVQEYLEGDSYSIEVIGKPGFYKTYEITQIHTDEQYDCCRVTTPCDIEDSIKEELRQIAQKLAQAVNLNGIMDVEVIMSKGIPKVLEIDARIPSQTPTAVYHTTGANLIDELWHLFCEGILPYRKLNENRYTIYEHLYVINGMIKDVGEHYISIRKPLSHYKGYWGADEAITDFKPGDKELVGTFIYNGNTLEEVIQKRSRVREELKICIGRN